VTTYDSIRHLLQQALDEIRSHLDGGLVPGDDREVVERFCDDLDRLVGRLDPVRLPGSATSTLGTDLYELMQRCQGPLERYRRFFEDAISVTKTESS
jgi:hypothetical protein